MMNTNGRGTQPSVVITGASTGIGEASALRLASMGFRVFAGVRKQADADALSSKAPVNGTLQPIMLDVTDAASIAAAQSAVADAVGERGLAGLVNNAGISVAAPMELVPLDELRRQLEVNLIGPVAVTQAFLPLIRKARGRIVNIGSIGGRISTPVLGPYSASKYAIEAITDALRIELRPWGINVAVVEPGSIATPIWEKGQGSADQLEAGLTPEAHAMYGGTIAAIRDAARQAERRGIPPDAVAKAVAHALTSKRPKTRYLVGFDARLQAALARIVPDRLLDRLIAGQLKLPKTPPDVTAAAAAPIEQPVR